MTTQARPSPSDDEMEQRAIEQHFGDEVESAAETETGPPAVELAVVELGEREVALEQLERHPCNRTPTAADVAERVERIVARRVGKDHYQIVSGETRWLAARKLEWLSVTARVIECTDAQALMMLAEYNAHRADLTPIDKARLIERLCQPVNKGGAGLTREQAAQSVGLQSHSAASNLVRLLKLPASVQTAIAEGRLPETYVRPLLPLLDGPARSLTEKAIGKQVKPSTDLVAETSRDDWAEAVVEEIVGSCGDMAPCANWVKTSEWNLKNGATRQGRLFDLIDADTRNRLQVVELPAIGPHGRKTELAVNKKLWTQLQLAAAKELLAKLKTQAAAGVKEKAGAERKLTPAQKRKAEQKAAGQLRDRVTGFRHRWIKGLLAQRVRENRPGAEIIVARITCWMALHPLTGSGAGFAREAVLQAANSKLDAHHHLAAWKPWAQADAETMRLLRSALVVAVLDKPDRDSRWPMVPWQVLLDLANEAKIDLAAEWAKGYSEADAQLFREFCGLHTRAQLAQHVRAEWKPNQTVALVLEGNGPRKALVDFLCKAASPWPLPKSLDVLRRAAAPAQSKRKAGRS